MWNVVIAGGGYGGLYAARALERKLPPNSARVTLVNDTNFFLFTPLLPGAAGGTLEPRHVVVPLRDQLDQTDLRLGRVVGANPDENCLVVHTLEGHEERLQYDHLIVTLGSVALEALKRIQYHELNLKESAARIHSWNGRVLVPIYHPSPQVLASHRREAEQLQDYKVVAKALKL